VRGSRAGQGGVAIRTSRCSCVPSSRVRLQSLLGVRGPLRRSESESQAELVADGAARLGSRAPARRALNSRGHIVFKFGLGDSDPRAAGGPCRRPGGRGRAGLAPRRAPAWRRPNLRFQSTRTSNPWLPTSGGRHPAQLATGSQLRPVQGPVAERLRARVACVYPDLPKGTF
jgi:hypothetical protein